MKITYFAHPYISQKGTYSPVYVATFIVCGTTLKQFINNHYPLFLEALLIHLNKRFLEVTKLSTT